MFSTNGIFPLIQKTLNLQTGSSHSLKNPEATNGGIPFAKKNPETTNGVIPLPEKSCFHQMIILFNFYHLFSIKPKKTYPKIHFS